VNPNEKGTGVVFGPETTPVLPAAFLSAAGVSRPPKMLIASLAVTESGSRRRGTSYGAPTQSAMASAICSS